jgi:hypothetical protein
MSDVGVKQTSKIKAVTSACGPNRDLGKCNIAVMDKAIGVGRV